AEEFVPATDTGIWLPPQRTFSPLDPTSGLDAERSTHVAIEAERDFGRSTLAVRAFHQRVDDQLVTLFGTELPAQPLAKLGHYFVADAGEANATGCAASVRAALSQYVNGSIEYTLARAGVTPTDRLHYLILVAPSTVRTSPERIHNLATSIETNVPETSTRVV